MKYEVQIGYDDYVAAQRLHMTPRRRFKLVLYPLLFLFALAALVAVHACLTGGARRPCFIFVGLAAYFFLLFRVLLPHRWKKNYQQQKLLHKPIQYEFTPDAFCSFADFGNATIPWKEFHKWREGKTIFLVYQSDLLFHLIPKRIFPGPVEQEQFRACLMDKIGKPVA